MNRVTMYRSKQTSVSTTTSVLFRGLLSASLGLVVLVYGIWRASQLPSFQWSSLIMPAVGLFLLAVSVWVAKEYPVARELDRDGVLAEGVVLEKWVKRDSDDDTRDCYVAYQFGDQHGAVQKVSSKTYRILQLGDTVDVRYLRRDPKLSRMEVDSWN